MRGEAKNQETEQGSEEPARQQTHVFSF
jgi:hypothetical protein